MRKKITVGIIGGGNMGSAIIGGIRHKFRVCVCEKDAKRSALLRKKWRVAVVDLKTLAARSSVIILAVKPQDFDGILDELKPFITPRHLVISIAAGITTLYIEKRLGRGTRVVRTMPNLPAQIGQGVTALCKGSFAKAADLSLAKDVFNRVGTTLVVGEKYINAVTAVSGSGPAYVFHFVEVFLAGAQAVGFSASQAKDLVFQTLRGSLGQLERSSDDASTLRKKVTSKGGTTQAALNVFHKANFEKTFARALKAAKKRAKELSK
jgi:pyrroline-5-carboxylate reductase